MDESFHRKCRCSRLCGCPVATMSRNNGPVRDDHQTDRLEAVHGHNCETAILQPRTRLMAIRQKARGSDVHDVPTEAKVVSRSLLLTAVSRASVTTLGKGRTMTGFQTVQWDGTFRPKAFRKAKSCRRRSSSGSKGSG
jgi:hypothetical protein